MYLVLVEFQIMVTVCCTETEFMVYTITSNVSSNQVLLYKQRVVKKVQEYLKF
jgi:hypothetical protein